MTSHTTEDTATTAADEGRHVAGVAKEQTAQVASEAAGAAKNVANDVLRNVSDAAREQGGTQRDKLVGTLSTLSGDLSSMADQAPSGLAGDLARQAADQARAMTSRLENRDPGEIVDDVRRFARQRPGVFLLGALAAGVVAGRLLAGARDGIVGAAATQEEPPTTPNTNGTSDLSGTGAAYPPAYMSDPGVVEGPEGSFIDGPETGYSGGGLSGGANR